jgi:hypothetical protein
MLATTMEKGPAKSELPPASEDAIPTQSENPPKDLLLRRLPECELPAWLVRPPFNPHRERDVFWNRIILRLYHANRSHDVLRLVEEGYFRSMPEISDLCMARQLQALVKIVEQGYLKENPKIWDYLSNTEIQVGQLLNAIFLNLDQLDEPIVIESLQRLFDKEPMCPVNREKITLLYATRDLQRDFPTAVTNLCFKRPRIFELAIKNLAFVNYFTRKETSDCFANVLLHSQASPDNRIDCVNFLVSQVLFWNTSRRHLFKLREALCNLECPSERAKHRQFQFIGLLDLKLGEIEKTLIKCCSTHSEVASYISDIYKNEGDDGLRELFVYGDYYFVQEHVAHLAQLHPEALISLLTVLGDAGIPVSPNILYDLACPLRALEPKLTPIQSQLKDRIIANMRIVNATYAIAHNERFGAILRNLYEFDHKGLCVFVLMIQKRVPRFVSAFNSFCNADCGLSIRQKLHVLSLTLDAFWNAGVVLSYSNIKTFYKTPMHHFCDLSLPYHERALYKVEMDLFKDCAQRFLTRISS